MNNKIIEEALGWVGTRFKHQGRLKKSEHHYGGCDCLGLVIGVAKSLGIKSLTGEFLESLDNPIYPKLLNSNILLDSFNKILKQVEIIDLQVGDIILVKVNNWPQHLAIISSLSPNIKIIHSYIQVRKVIEQHLPEEWLKKIIAVYRFDYN